MKQVFCIVAAILLVTCMPNVVCAKVAVGAGKPLLELKVADNGLKSQEAHIESNPATMDSQSKLGKSNSAPTIVVSDAVHKSDGNFLDMNAQAKLDQKNPAEGILIPEDKVAPVQLPLDQAKALPFDELKVNAKSNQSSSGSTGSLMDFKQLQRIPRAVANSAYNAGLKTLQFVDKNTVNSGAFGSAKTVSVNQKLVGMKNVPIGIRRKMVGEIRKETTATGRDSSNSNYTVYTVGDVLHDIGSVKKAASGLFKKTDQAAKDQAAKDQAAKDQAAKDQAAADPSTKDQAEKSQAEKSQAEKDQVERIKSSNSIVRSQADRQAVVNQRVKEIQADIAAKASAETTAKALKSNEFLGVAELFQPTPLPAQ